MKRVHVAVGLMLFAFCSLLTQAQQTVATNTNVVVPPLVNFSGALTDGNGRPLTGDVSVTFSLYSEQSGGAALWMETQNVTTDSQGHYTVMLGSTSTTGLPADIFVAGEAHWLGVQVQGQEEEQPRVLLVSAPYALKAGDAQTLGGLPPSAFVLAVPPASGAATAAPEAVSANTNISVSPATSSDVTTTGGTPDALPLFTTTTNIQNSILTQTGTTAINVDGRLNLPALGTATSSAGFNSRPQDFVASAYNSSTAAAVAQTFQWQAQAAGNDTATPSATLNLLFGSGTSTPAQTGLNIASTGLITFAKGQTFPGTGKGTITGVTAGTDLTGGGTSGSVTLNVDTTKIPQLSAANTFTGNQAITGNLTDTGNITATGSITGETATFSANTSSPAVNITQSGGGTGLYVNAPSGYYGFYVNGDAVGALGNALVTGGWGVVGSSTGGRGVYGIDEATSGPSVGVLGASTSPAGYGVVAQGPDVGVYGSNNSTSTTLIDCSYCGGFGVAGQSGNVGVFGYAPSLSNEGYFDGENSGVWGDSGGPASSYSGVLGTADDNSAGAFLNQPSTSGGIYGNATLYAENDSNTSGSLVFETFGLFGGTCTIDIGANLTCSGTVKGVVPAAGGARKVSLYAMQSAENWFEDAGSGQLSHGSATIALDSTFAQTVNTRVEYHVFLTPKGDCEGLYVSHETPQGFEVHELRGGRSSIAFDYRIMAKRSGYENVRLTDVTEQYQKMEQQQKLRRERMEQRRAARSAARPIAAAAATPHN